MFSGVDDSGGLLRNTPGSGDPPAENCIPLFFARWYDACDKRACIDTRCALCSFLALNILLLLFSVCGGGDCGVCVWGGCLCVLCVGVCVGVCGACVLCAFGMGVYK